jgi:hypothetical protein
MTAGMSAKPKPVLALDVLERLEDLVADSRST